MGRTAAGRGTRTIALLVGSAVGCGCLTSNLTAHRVPTTPDGAVEFAAAGGVTALALEEEDENGNVTRGYRIVPAVEFGIRQGLAEHLDFGGRVYLVPLAARFDLKWQWHESMAWSASVAPGLTFGIPWIVPGFNWIFPWGRVNGSVDPIVLHLPLLFGIWVEQHQLVFAPKLDTLFYTRPYELPGGDSTHVVVSAGGMVGFDINLMPTGHLMPEVDVHCAVGTGQCAVVLGVVWYGYRL